MSKTKTDIIPAKVSGTLAGLFRERVKRSPDKVAYRQYHEYSRQWRDTTWKEMATEVARWQDALAKEGLQHGDRVAILLRNCKEWVTFDQAALGCGLAGLAFHLENHHRHSGPGRRGPGHKEQCQDPPGRVLPIFSNETQGGLPFSGMLSNTEGWEYAPTCIIHYPVLMDIRQCRD